METVLVVGGAGYIGSTLVRELLAEGHKVRVLDNLSFGGDSIVDLVSKNNFEFYKGDVRNEEDIKKALVGVDHVVHLAAIVGDPACAQNPELAKEINVKGAKKTFQLAEESGAKRFVFASTCSNYGKMEDPNSFVNEESDLRPVSLYAQTKVEMEKFLLENSESRIIPTVLRFSTVYGLSPRLRFDLTVNEFTKELALGRELVVFGEQFWRPYCHVIDLCRSVTCVLKADESKVRNEVFNVGNTEENYQKKMIVDEIVKLIPDAKIKYVQKNEDPRDYRVSFEKIGKVLGFKTLYKVPEEIKNIKLAVENLITNPDEESFKNV
jgi:nucleoside-diphosphate-sugar epimerase